MGLYLVVGLGTFGSNAVRALSARGHQVIAVDKDKAMVQAAKPYATQAIEGDAFDKRIFRSLGLSDADAGIVSLGEKMDSSILVALYLKAAGIKQIIVKAVTEDHAKVLKKMGVSEVILPEKDTAYALAERLSAKSILGEFHILKGYSILDRKAPESFWGKSIAKLNIKDKLGVSIMLIQRGIEVLASPCADDVILEGDILVILGKDNDIEKFKNQIKD